MMPIDPKQSEFTQHHFSAKQKSGAGFTLVEIVISLGIFTVVAVVAVGALVSIVDANKKSQTSNTVILDLGSAIESFSREMRVGRAYYCGQNDTFNTSPDGKSLVSQACSVSGGTAGGGKVIAFKSTKSDSGCPLVYAYRFRFDTTATPNHFRFEKAKQTQCSGELTFSSIVSDDVVITDYRFGVLYDSITQPYPLAFIRIVGYVGARDREKTEFDLQTTVSQRILE